MLPGRDIFCMRVKLEPIKLMVVMYPLQSGNIKAVGYSGKSQQLLVVYGVCAVLYMKVPVKVFKAMMGATSPASYFSRNIRNKYVCVRITNKEDVDEALCRSNQSADR